MKYQTELEYIQHYWPKLMQQPQSDYAARVGLPYRYITPSAGIFLGDQFYWDSYFIIIGLVLQAEYLPVAQGMVDNLVALYERFHIMPSRNRFYNTGISQPPLLTSMMWEVYQRNHNREWLARITQIARQEYEHYWLYDGHDHREANAHRVYQGLSRYCDHSITHVMAEHESGWDMTSRFNARCLDYLPIDLNSLLYLYETDLAGAYRMLGDTQLAQHFANQAKQRQTIITKLCWDDTVGLFFDYNYHTKQRSDFWSLASFYPLFTKVATTQQAARLHANLQAFLQPGGLVNTLTNPLKGQWDYPNGWANQHWIVVRGLLNYGYDTTAREVTERWLNLNSRVFTETGKFWECYNVVHQTAGSNERYERQYGFGWTNGVFARLVHELFQ